MDFPSLLPQNYRSLLPFHSKSENAPAAASAEAGMVQDVSAPGIFERLVNRLEDAYWRQITKSREAYLARAQNSSELENRMKELDSNSVIRWRTMS